MTEPTVTLPVDPHYIQRIEAEHGEYAVWVSNRATVYVVTGESVAVFVVGDDEDEQMGGSMLILRQDVKRSTQSG